MTDFSMGLFIKILNKQGPRIKSLIKFTLPATTLLDVFFFRARRAHHGYDARLTQQMRIFPKVFNE
jgi:hypothetical protein